MKIFKKALSSLFIIFISLSIQAKIRVEGKCINPISKEHAGLELSLTPVDTYKKGKQVHKLVLRDYYKNKDIYSFFVTSFTEMNDFISFYEESENREVLSLQFFEKDRMVRGLINSDNYRDIDGLEFLSCDLIIDNF